MAFWPSVYAMAIELRHVHIVCVQRPLQERLIVSVSRGDGQRRELMTWCRCANGKVPITGSCRN